MTEDPSGSKIQKILTARQIKQLADWFRESDEAGFKPRISVPSETDELRAKLNHIYGRTADGRRWPRT